MKITEETTSQSLTGYAYLREMEKKLGADEVRRVETFRLFSDWLEDIVINEYDLMKVPLPIEFLEMVWHGAVDNANIRHEFIRSIEVT